MSEFDCGNRTSDCDNATMCPCMDFINKETKNYSELLQSNIFREATNEQMKFPNTFEEFINEYSFKDRDEVYTNGCELIQVFRVMQGYEHFVKQVRTDAIDELLEKLSPCCDCNACEESKIQNFCMSETLLSYEEIVKKAEQLKREKND